MKTEGRDRLFVCNCNAIREGDVEKVLDRGVTGWRDVHAAMGCAPQCGCCEFELTEMIEERKEADASRLCDAA